MPTSSNFCKSVLVTPKRLVPCYGSLNQFLPPPEEGGTVLSQKCYAAFLPRVVLGASNSIWSITR